MSAATLDILTIMMAQTPGAGPTPVPESLQVQSVWDFVVKGGVMMIPIGLCSLIALTVVAERVVRLRRRRVIPPDFAPALRRELAGAGDTTRALEFCRRDGSPVANVFAAGIRRLGGPLEVVERHIQESGQREVLKLRARLRVLAVIAAVAPLLGLLGTIFGMITAFQTVATSADALGKTELLAGGIYEAMITTAAGLIVAIPTLVAYHWLSARVQALVMEIDQETVDFLESLVDEAAKPATSAAPHLEPRAGTVGADEPPPLRHGRTGPHAALPVEARP